MPDQHFFVEGRSLGSCPRYPIHQHGHPDKPQSFAFFCPVCAEVWARAVIFDTKFRVFTVPCRKHTHDGWRVPGSLWLPLELDFIAAFSGEVLKREFLLHLDYAESKLCQT